MTQIFLTIVEMSATASFVAAIIMMARLFLKKSPKIFSYALWAAVLFRMLSPVAIESNFGFSMQLPSEITNLTKTTEVVTNYSENYITREITVFSPEVAQNVGVTVSDDFIRAFTNAAPIVWLIGIFILIVYAAVSYVKINRKIFAAVRVRENIFESDQIISPFVIGFFRPRIIIPTGLSENETDYIIRHEKTHIRRGDHFVKLIAFAGIALHWFNPLMWASYFLMSRDMELSCDESVMRRAKTDIRQSYSHSLLNMCVRQSGLPNPISFCESNVKSRVKNILAFKKSSRLILITSTIFTFVIFSFCVVNAVSPINNFSAEPEETFFLHVGDNERQMREDFLSACLSRYNLEFHNDGKFEPSGSRTIRNLINESSAQIITVEYVRPRPTWHNITSFVKINAAPGECSPHMDVLLENIHGDNGGVPWLIASYRADAWEIHALYGFANGEHQLENIVTWQRGSVIYANELANDSENRDYAFRVIELPSVNNVH